MPLIFYSQVNRDQNRLHKVRGPRRTHVNKATESTRKITSELSFIISTIKTCFYIYKITLTYHYLVDYCSAKPQNYPTSDVSSSNSCEKIWKFGNLLEISMDVIGQHLDLLYSDWSTFGNLNLEERRLLSARMTRKFVKRSKFFCHFQFEKESTGMKLSIFMLISTR